MVSLVAILSTLVALNLQPLPGQARARSAAVEMVSVRDAMLIAAKDCRGLPVATSDAGDPGLAYPPAWGAGCWRGPYLPRWPVSSAVGGAYQYYGPGGDAAAVVRVTSLSADAARALAAELAAGAGGAAALRYTADRDWMAELTIASGYIRSGGTGAPPGE